MRIENRIGNLHAAAVAVAVIPLSLALAACGDDSSTATGENGVEAGGSEDGGGDDDLAIEVTEPVDGAEVGGAFDLTFDVGVPVGEPDTGRHHIHVYYDGETSEGDYDLVYEDSHTVERALEPGEHEIEAVIANADHSLTDARDSVTVSVGDGATTGDDGNGEDSDSDDDDDGSGGFDY